MRYEHDCSECKPLGMYAEYDLYICNQGFGNITTIVARYGNQGEQYITHPLYLSTSMVAHQNMVAVALGKAVELGYIDIKIPTGSARMSVVGVQLEIKNV